MDVSNMGDDTSIRVSEELADELYERKGRGKSYEDFIWELLEDEDADATAEREADLADVDDGHDVPLASHGGMRERAEAILDDLSVKGRPASVERTRRQAIMYGWERLREEGTMKPRDLANDIFGQYFEDPDLGYSTASSRYAGYQLWDSCVRDVLKQLPGIHPTGQKWQFREETIEG